MRPASKIASSLLLVILLLSVMKNTVLYAIYENNTGLFISLFCENKSRPQLNCNGRCKLAMMQKEQDRKEAASTLDQLQSEIVFYSSCHQFETRFSDIPVADLVQPAARYNQLYSFLFTMSLVKPPDADSLHSLV